MRKPNWEMVAVAVTLVGVIYMVGNKEGAITSAVNQNRIGIDRMRVQLNELSRDVNRLIAVEQQKVTLNDMHQPE